METTFRRDILSLQYTPGNPPGPLWIFKWTLKWTLWGWFEEALAKKGPSRPFLQRSLDNSKLEFVAWFNVNLTFGSREMMFLILYGPCPPGLIRVDPCSITFHICLMSSCSISDKLLFLSANNSVKFLCSNNEVFIKDLICSKTKFWLLTKMNYTKIVYY